MLSEPFRLTMLGGLRLQQGQNNRKRTFARAKPPHCWPILPCIAPGNIPAKIWWNGSGRMPIPIRERPLHNLSQALSTLRRYLEPTPGDKGRVLCATHTHVSLNPHVIAVDVAEFEALLALAERDLTSQTRSEHLASAIALYAGELLPGSYEEWVMQERERLRGRFAQALLQLAEHVGGQGDCEQAIDLALRAAQQDAYSEPAHFALIRWCLASGQNGSAWTHFAAFEARLAEDLRAAPSAALLALIQRGKRNVVASVPNAFHSMKPVASLRPKAPADVTPAPAVIIRMPLMLTAFFGREAEIREADTILTSARLLTLTGPGGSGKTRLALEIGRSLAAKFDMVVFVSLADVADDADILPAVADALTTAFSSAAGSETSPPAPPQDMIAYIKTLLAARKSLLILDNFEHLTEGAHVVSALLAHCSTFFMPGHIPSAAISFRGEAACGRAVRLSR